MLHFIESPNSSLNLMLQKADSSQISFPFSWKYAWEHRLLTSFQRPNFYFIQSNNACLFSKKPEDKLDLNIKDF